MGFFSRIRRRYLYVNPGSDGAHSSTFLSQGDANATVYDLAPQSGDPFTISEHPRLGTLTLNLTRNSHITNDNLLAYLSKEPLTDVNGFFTTDIDAYNTLLHFPVLSNGENQFFYSYLHPGEYYVTIIADKDGDFTPSQGDVSSISKLISIGIEENKTENITNINIQN